MLSNNSSRDLFKTAKNRLNRAFSMIECVIAMAVIVVMIALVFTAAELGIKAQTKYNYRLMASSAGAEMYSAFSQIYCGSYYGTNFKDSTSGDTYTTDFIKSYCDNLADGLGFERIDFDSGVTISVSSGSLTFTTNSNDSYTVTNDGKTLEISCSDDKTLEISCTEAYIYQFEYSIGTQVTINAAINFTSTENNAELFTVTAKLDGYTNSVYSATFTLITDTQGNK